MLRSFRPLFLLSNPHVQTVVANTLTYGAPSVDSQTLEVALDDGDRLVLHDSVPPGWRAKGPAVLLMHGLGGSHLSAYMRRTGARLLRKGVRVFRMDLRGAGAGLGLARRLYNADSTMDARRAAEAMIAAAPGSPLGVLGFSLGGNIALNFAASLKEAPLAPVRAAAALAPPIDLLACSVLLRRQPFYDRYYVGHLLRAVKAHQRLFPGLPRVDFPRNLTLAAFDDLYTAPNWGYAGVEDYYRRASSAPRLAHINIPTLILTARDDPFVDSAPFEASPPNDHLRIEIHPHGGHLGFLGSDGHGGVRWGESRLIDWLTAHLLPLPQDRK